ncbi:MAG TPA: lysophospholipid acyltransferase family protein [Clostridia bacterium]|nr:lysophospholipid acyltransferase family protein [Clostridia bacterium]
MRQRLEYAPVWLFVRLLGVLPRPMSRAVAITIAFLIYALHGRLRRVGLRNLELAMPEKPLAERRRILRGVFRSLGRLLAEFCKFPSYTRENVSRVAVYQGFENFEAAHNRGKGVIFLTAHLGGWEIGSFVHSLYGHPLNVVVRGLDNSYLNTLVDHYRTLHGNRTFDKGDFARGLIGAMRKGETVGILMDTNMTPPQGVFVDYFGHAACTAAGAARVALRTGAAVVPGFTVWDDELGKYRIEFAPAIPLVNSGDDEADAVANTQTFTKVIEDFVRRHPDQWLWVHRRWKSRPPAEPPLY